MEDYYPLEQPEDLTKREKEDAMGAYLMMFAAMGAGLPLPIINLIAAVIYYFINRSKNRFVRFHTLQSLLSQFPTSLINAVAVIWAVRIYLLQVMEMSDLFKGYLIMMLVANLIYFIFSIIAAVKARNGEMYYFLFFGRYAYHKVYQVREIHETKPVNHPPR